MESLLGYVSSFGLPQVEKRYREAKTEFERVKSSYSGFYSFQKKDIGEDDKISLINCIRVLLPFGTEDAIEDFGQEQMEQTEKFEGTLRYKIGELNVQILEYLVKSRKERFWA